MSSDEAAPFIIQPVRTSIDLEASIALFRAYVASLDLDLSFQSFEAEITSMPGRYAVEAGGELLLARESRTQQPVGCVALRCLSDSPPSTGQCTTNTTTMEPRKDVNAADDTEIAEIKRLYTVPASRGSGLGRALAKQIIKVAEDLGYDEIKLDTLPSMAGAQAIYEKLGFVDIVPYCYNPVEATRYLGLKLSRRTIADGRKDEG